MLNILCHPQADTDSQNDLVLEQGASGDGNGAAMRDLLSALNAAMQNGALSISCAMRKAFQSCEPCLCVLPDLIVSCGEDPSSICVCGPGKHAAPCSAVHLQSEL